MVAEEHELEPWKEKLLRKASRDDSFSDAATPHGSDDDDDDILVHGSDDGPSSEDRELLNEEDEREKLLTRGRRNPKVLVGKHARRRSTESLMEDGTLSRVALKVRRSSTRRRCTAKRVICCHIVVIALVIIGVAIALCVRVFSRPVRQHKRPTDVKTLSNGTHNYQPTVLIISLDGFRPDYIDIGVTPYIHRLREEGVAPEYMKPSFPSVTFPNHYTLVTGLYPESHGVVGNEYWDPVQGKEFSISHPDQSLPSAWWEGTSGGLVEPIWVTAEKQGVITAIHMWPGSEAVIQGIEPTHVDKFSQDELLSNKVNRVMSWLDLDDSERPAFIATYVPTIDTIGHHFGPGTPEMNSSLAQVDAMIGSVLEGISRRNLTDIVDLIIVSDHGMASTSKDRLIYLDSLVDLSTIEHIDCWPLKGLRPRTSENVTALYEYLKVLSIDQHWNVYLRDFDMPPRWHFSESYRIAPIYLVPDPEWVIVNSLAEFDPEEDEEYHPRGIHGYDNDDALMRSLFLARGPSFQYTYPIRPFENVEVYGIMTNILGIAANANNGTFDKGRLERLPVSQTPSNPTTSVDDVSEATPSATYDENGLPEMTPEDWEQIEDDVEEAVDEDRPLTWKEYLELKAVEMKEEIDSWWDWMKHGGKESDEGTR